ncbi:MAG: DUF547 domain-containing protein [Planctomycetota bacterium]|nr:DUF547 domain-containing protein [Planctomycetota bacterium]
MTRQSFLPTTLILSALLMAACSGGQADSGKSTKTGSNPSAGSQPATGSRPSTSSQPSSGGGGSHSIAAVTQATIAAQKAAEEAKLANEETNKVLAKIDKRLDQLVRLVNQGDLGKRLKDTIKDTVVETDKWVNFDHADFDKLLKTYVKDGEVDYKTWKAKDLPALDKYLDRVRSTNPAKLASDKHRMVFWINVYNAWTLRSMLGFYPTESILNHTKEKTSDGFDVWKNNPIKIDGKDYHLNGIENEILRPMGDARIHFAVVCASIGCPPLLSEAYTVKDLGAQMDKSARIFFATPSKFKVDSGTVYISKIFDWYKVDFGTEPQAVLKYCATYVSDPAAKKLMLSGTAKLGYLKYNWNINEQK